MGHDLDIRRAARAARLAVFTLAALSLGACVTTEPRAGYGMQAQHLAFVPAATAILPCRAWPAGARFLDLPLTTAKDAEVKELCAAVDQAVVKAYEGQPFMRGYSPKSVLKSVTEAGKPALLDEALRSWSVGADACRDCESPPAFYAASIASRPEWLAWLSTLSQTARNADAVLLPFVTFAYEKRYNDRGLVVAERAVGVALLLVDTDHGDLIWAGGREATLPAKRLANAPDAQTLQPPSWSEVMKRLFTEDLWRDFPGRQVY